MQPIDCVYEMSYCGQNKRECICLTCQTIRFVGRQNYYESQAVLRKLKGHKYFMRKWSEKPSFIAGFKRQWNDLPPAKREAYRERYWKYLNKHKTNIKEKEIPIVE